MRVPLGIAQRKQKFKSACLVLREAASCPRGVTPDGMEGREATSRVRGESSPPSISENSAGYRVLVIYRVKNG